MLWTFWIHCFTSISLTSPTGCVRFFFQGKKYLLFLICLLHITLPCGHPGAVYLNKSGWFADSPEQHAKNFPLKSPVRVAVVTICTYETGIANQSLARHLVSRETAKCRQALDFGVLSEYQPCGVVPCSFRSSSISDRLCLSWNDCWRDSLCQMTVCFLFKLDS